jgi:hypothetical protein
VILLGVHVLVHVHVHVHLHVLVIERWNAVPSWTYVGRSARWTRGAHATPRPVWFGSWRCSANCADEPVAADHEHVQVHEHVNVHAIACSPCAGSFV